MRALLFCCLVNGLLLGCGQAGDAGGPPADRSPQAVEETSIRVPGFVLDYRGMNYWPRGSLNGLSIWERLGQLTFSSELEADLARSSSASTTSASSCRGHRQGRSSKR
jgi:hypothetical protein